MGCLSKEGDEGKLIFEENTHQSPGGLRSLAIGFRPTLATRLIIFSLLRVCLFV